MPPPSQPPSLPPSLSPSLAARRPIIRRQWAWQYALLAALVAGLGITLLYPIGLTIAGAFLDENDALTVEPVVLVFRDPALRRGLINAMLIAVATTVVSMAIALPPAMLAARYRFPLKGALSSLILVPLILPPFVGAIGMQALLGRHGGVNALLGTEYDFLGNARFWGVVVVEALHLYPIIYLNATAALANLDPALSEAAENLGASPARRFLRITLPLIRPGLFAGGTIVFIWSLTELGTPLVFDYTTVTPVQVFFGLKEIEGSAQPYALTAVMLTAAIGAYVLGKLAFGGRAHAMYAKAARAADQPALPPVLGWLAAAVLGGVTLLALLPHLGVIGIAFSPPGRWYDSVLPGAWTLDNAQTALSGGLAFNSIVNSLKFASAAVVIDLVVGLLAAYLLVRTRLKGLLVLDSLCMLPLAVPGLVMAFGYAAMTLRWPFAPGDPLEGVVSVITADPNPIPLLIVAYAVRRLPYVVRAAVAGLEQTSGELEEAAMNLGASRITAVRRVIVPLIAANLIAGALLAFSFAMLEVSDSLILAQKQEHYPITKAIYTYLNRLGDGPSIAAALGVWGMALLTVTLVGASVLMGKKLGSIFRV